MNGTAIRWTNETWNPVHGCSKVSDGCKHCYAMTLSLERGWTKADWTIQHEDENVLLKPHKLSEPYKLEPGQRVFANSMSDMFHRAIPDWYKAAAFCVMLDLESIIFQILTKRSEATIDWHERFLIAVRSDEFKAFAATVKHKKVKAALEKAERYTTPWGANIWQGVSVEDGRVLHRIDDLQRSGAAVKFISAEPLLGAWGDSVDLSGIDWLIVGGESGDHMLVTDESGKRVPNEKRWMKMEWARAIKQMCVDQGVAFFFKQDSGYRTEQRTYLVEADDSKWEWQQYPGTLIPPREVGDPKSLFGNWDHKTEDTSFSLCSYIAHLWENRAYQLDGFRAENAAIAAAWWYKALEELRPPLPVSVSYESSPTDPAPASSSFQPDPDPIAPIPPPSPTQSMTAFLASAPTPQQPDPKTTVVAFQDVKAHWIRERRVWDSSDYVYIGREMPGQGLDASPFANPFRITSDTVKDRATAIEQYRVWLRERLSDPIRGAYYRAELEKLRGKTLVCFCKPKACHGDFLLSLLGEIDQIVTVDESEPEHQPEQLPLFDMGEVASKRTFAY